MNKFKLNKLKKGRMLLLSPTVQAQLESELNLNDFDVLDRLGEGAFGKVYKCRHKST